MPPHIRKVLHLWLACSLFLVGCYRVNTGEQEGDLGEGILIVASADGAGIITSRDVQSVTLTLVPGDSSPPLNTVFEFFAEGGLFAVDSAQTSTQQITYDGRLTLGKLSLMMDSSSTSTQEIILSVRHPSLSVTLIGDTRYAVVGDASGSATIAGEDFTAAEDWQVRLFWDFSDDFIFDAADYVDGTNVESNRPVELHYLLPPFSDGFVVVAGRQFLEMPVGGQLVDHDLTPEGGDGSLRADGPTDITLGWRSDTDASLYVSSASANSGDGLYQINRNWQMSKIASRNNCDAVVVAPANTFDDLPAEAHYVSCGSGTSRDDELTFSSAHFFDLELLPNFDLLGSSLTSDRQVLSRIRNGTHVIGQFTNITGTTVSIVSGDTAALPGFAYVIINKSQLWEVYSDGSYRILAQSQSADWRWQSATVPPTAHPTGADGPVIVLLESNRTLDVDRLVVFSKL